ncbi:hypothetical protein AGMMS50225_08060 [Betaproteobacteria bacterium]|nr:hypothetical protein AGMMS50225_08060 [Betaproteobacteria bacterium]
MRHDEHFAAYGAAPPTLAMRLFCLLLAGLGLVGLVLFGRVYPPGALVAVALVGAFMVVLGVHRLAWLWVLPGLMPVIDLVPWTGSFYLAESDALVLSAFVVCGLRGLSGSGRGGEEHGNGDSGWHFGVLSWVLLLLIAASYLLSTSWGPLVHFLSQPEWRVGYFSPLNGVRLSKGMVWAVLLLPLFADAFRRQPQQAGRALVGGIVLGLVLVALAASWERWAFPGLSDFASDYRTTALFWEMNVGGATLDGWLALAVPFILWRVLQPASPRLLAGLLPGLALVAYACFTTFSRGLYAGLALGCALTVVLWMRTGRHHGQAPFTLRAVLGWGVYAALVGILLVFVFRTGGYRGLAAMLGVALATFASGPVVVTAPWRAWTGALTVALVASVALSGSALAAWLMPKGVYLAYGASALVFGLLWWRRQDEEAAAEQTLLLAALVWLAGNAVLVTAWWSEGRGVGAGMLAALVVLAPLGMIRVNPRLGWRVSAQTGVVVALVLGVLALGVLASGTYYASKRFETVSGDLGSRWRHWAMGASLPESGAEQWFGIGVGRYAERFFLQKTVEGAYPGTHQLSSDDDGRHFLRLGGPRHQLGFGEIYRVSQRVSSTLKRPLVVMIDARAPNGGAERLHVEICRKHLLYARGCAIKSVGVPGGGWKQLEFVLDSKDFGAGADRLPRPAVFSLADVTKGGMIDIAKVSVIDAKGTDLLDNGDFAAGGDFWFFSSDNFHLPWQEDNLWLHLWVEQGWFGVIAFSLLGLVALWRVSMGRAAHHPLAPPLAGAMLGFFSLGAFNSLVNAPRLTTFVFMLMWVALGVRVGREASDGRRA